MASSEQLLKVYKELERRIAEIDVRQGGPIGPRGPVGPKGRKGEKGSAGPKGEQGLTGKQGPQGPQGPAGKDGKDGKDGKQGPRGPQGLSGRDGAPGADGNHGRDGIDGVGVQDAQIDFDGHLTLNMTDGTVIDAGYIGSDKEGNITYIRGGGYGGGGGGGDTPPHNQLTGLQGGASDEYYHLTADEYTTLQDWINNGIVQSVVGGNAITVDATDPINPVVNADTFTGAGTTGVVPDPTTELGYFLTDDGSFQPAPVSPVGAVFVNYRWDSGTTPPAGLGDIGVNNADQTLATELYASGESDPGNDLNFVWENTFAGEYIGLWEAGGESIYYVVTSDPVYDVGNDSWTVPIAYISGVGGIDNNREVQCFFIANPSEKIPSGGLTGQSLTKNSDTDYDDSWQNKVSTVVAGDNITVDATDPFNPIVSASGGENIALTDNITYTVGAGQDFETIDEAFVFINSAPIGAGNAQSDFADTRIPRYTLALTAGTFVPESTNNFLRMEGTTAQVAIVGAGSGLTTLGVGTGSNLQFTNCNNIRFDSIRIEGYLTSNNSTVIFGYSAFDIDLTGCYLNGSHQTEYRLDGDLACKYLHLETGSVFKTNNVTLVNDETVIPALVVSTNSFLSCTSLTATMPVGASSTAIECLYDGVVAGSGSLTLNGGSAGTSAIEVGYSAKVQFGTGIVDNSSYGSVGNVPVGQIQPDTSVIADGTTKVGGGQVDSVVGGTDITVDSSDPANPIVNYTGTGGDSYWEPGTNPDDIVNSNAGNVGIGTATPGRALTVENGLRSQTLDGSAVIQALYNSSLGYPGAGTILMRFASGLSVNDGVSFQTATRIDGVTDGVWDENQSPGSLVFNTTSVGSNGASERMRIDSAGNVGIGTTTPEAPLDVVGGFDIAGGGIHITSATGSQGVYWHDVRSNVAPNRITCTTLATDPYMSFFTNSSESMRIDSDGNVGIGTATPAATLDVSNNSGNTEVSLSAVAGTAASLNLKSNVFNQIAADTTLGFNVAGPERMRIDSNGNVGIGSSDNDIEIYPDVGNETAFIRARNNSSNANRNLQLNAATFTFSTSEDNSTPILTLTNNNEVRGLFKGPTVSNPDTAFRVQTSPAADPDPNIIYFIVA